jgi:hypothetical protein
VFQPAASSQAHPSDRRRVTVAATPSAHRATLEFLRPSILAVDELSRALDPEAHRIVTEFLQRSTRAMQQ